MAFIVTYVEDGVSSTNCNSFGSNGAPVFISIILYLMKVQQASVRVILVKIIVGYELSI